jgi:hypothetical protein
MRTRAPTITAAMAWRAVLPRCNGAPLDVLVVLVVLDVLDVLEVV